MPPLAPPCSKLDEDRLTTIGYAEQDHLDIRKPGKRLARPGWTATFVSSDSLLADSYLATGRGQPYSSTLNEFAEPAIESNEEPDENATR